MSRLVEPAARRRVLVVDDDPTVAEVVARYLEREGFSVSRAPDGAAALARASAEQPDLIVLDLMLPGVDGLEVCRKLRADGPVPIIMLTARGEESDRVVGLEVGADDYVAKPFSPRELVARVKAVLRRSSGALVAPATDGARAVIEIEGIRVDVHAREALVDGRPAALTTLEFDLLAFLMRHPRTVFSREALLAQVWGFSSGDTSTVTVHVRRLREKIERDPTRPERVKTVWGAGYRFDP